MSVALSVAPTILKPTMTDAGESAETARPPGSMLAEMALLAGGKRPFCHARRRPRKFLLKVLRRRTPEVTGLLVDQRTRTLNTAAFSAPCARDDGWISLSCGRPSGLCRVGDRQAGRRHRLLSAPPILPGASDEPELATRSGCCCPFSPVQARRPRSQLRRPLPRPARTRPAPLPLPAPGPASSAPLRQPAGEAAAVHWPICVVADWLPMALAGTAHLAYRWSLSGGAAAWYDFVVPAPRWSVPSGPSYMPSAHSQSA